MKKRLCIFLICWLPCFVMAASVMSMQMMLSQLSLETQQAAAHAHDAQAMSEMPCHEHQSAHSSETANETSTTQIHHCDVCGFCAISGGVAHFHALSNLPLLALSSAAPLFMGAPVHSQTYPPAIKPPIFS
ncbi:MAG: hypothetical protein ACTS9Y_11315 [Methylophilus sp.]|uniref:hypothetical protein n=1 Tax=Methylophilus sp. TaxID=29541 RepID=UPI003FA0FBEB